ncbi:glycerophosphodiester phosphodiesterase [Nonomuraea sp. SBT364]|uniref:glycerophosphodiester phosphodiesterase n=1 Tax=Nonomuraea sp. SBT364 TaxID=1580530 RepID=UPI00066D6F8F|nr:glycerophosphodiester phosphodiesterase family protein [Nonomuraea sp. SBT364]
MFRLAGLIVMTVLALFASPATAAPASTANVAHRGASAYAPENTLAAFRLAAEQGADAFELDVQLTSDDQLILMHDTTLARTTDAERVFPGRAPWRVGDFTLEEIRELDAGSWFGRQFAGEPVPTLREALREMSGSGLGLLVEIKEPRLHRGIEVRAAGELRRSWPGPLIVQSFDRNSMRRFHDVMPEAPIGLLGTPAAAELDALSSFADLINPPHRGLTRDYVRLVHRHGMRVFAWTVDDAATMRRLLSYDVDGLITNRPDVLGGL